MTIFLSQHPREPVQTKGRRDTMKTSHYLPVLLGPPQEQMTSIDWEVGRGWGTQEPWSLEVVSQTLRGPCRVLSTRWALRSTWEMMSTWLPGPDIPCHWDLCAPCKNRGCFSKEPSCQNAVELPLGAGLHSQGCETQELTKMYDARAYDLDMGVWKIGTMNN